MDNKQSNSKKRTFQEFEQNNSDNVNVDYQDQNKLLRELAMERAQRQQQTQQQNQQSEHKEEEKIQETINSINNQQQQQNSGVNGYHKQQSQYYLNKIKNYPEEQQTDYMLDFHEYFCEDPFYKSKKQTPKKTFQSVFMTTFGFDPDHLVQIAQQKVNFVLANDRNKEEWKQGRLDIVKNFCEFQNWTLIHPPKDYSQPYPGPFHPKLWLIKFPEFLRVVVGSGNLTQEDWTCWGQGVWFQDFRRKNISEMGQQQFENSQFDFNKDFKESLSDFVQKIMPSQIKNYKELLQIDLEDYVYENVQVILVPGVPGRYSGANFKKYNKGKIKHILGILKGENKLQNPVLTYQTTSCGKVDANFIEEMHNCMTPRSNSFSVVSDDRKLRRKNKLENNAPKSMRMVYPTLKYVIDETLLGVDYAQTLYLQKEHFSQDSFPKCIMHRYEGNEEYFFHQGTIPHLKTGIVTGQDNEITDDTVIYCGSHNYTQAAWGRLEKDMSQMNNNNTELGILYPPMKNSKQLKKQLVDNLPWKFPPTKYQGNDRPFMWGDMRE